MTTKRKNGYSEKSYITIDKAKEATTVLKEFLKKSQDLATQEESKKVSVKPKIRLEDIEGGSEEAMMHCSVILHIVLKKIPLNRSTYINRIGPLPHPWRFETPTLDICLIVRDLDTKNPLKDRELDLELTRTAYREKLETAGFDEDFLNHRLAILPMRELLTEYIESQAKGNLVTAYDVFLADQTLMKSKVSGLNTFLGNKFWVKRKKVPIPINLKLTGHELKEEVMRALDSTELPVTGNGGSLSCKIASLTQSPQAIAYNLLTVLSSVRGIFDKNVSTLSLGVSSGSSFQLPFFVDYGSPNDIQEEEIAPKRKRTNEEKEAFKVKGIMKRAKKRVHKTVKKSSVVNED